MSGSEASDKTPKVSFPGYMNAEVPSAVWAADPPALRNSTAGLPLFLITALTLGSGLLNIYSVTIPVLQDRTEILRRLLPLEVIHYARSLSLLAGFALVVLSINIWRRKTRAWAAVMAFSAASVVLHLVKGFDYEEAALGVVFMGLLWETRRRFTVRSRDVDWQSAALRTAVALAVAIGYGVLGFWLLDPAHFGRNFDWKQSIVQTLQVLAFDGNPLLARTWYARWFLESLNLVTAATLAYSGWSLFRPAVHRFRTQPASADRAKAIVQRHGRTAQDFFKYSSDKSFFFSECGSAFLAYRVAAGFAVVLGDPVGPSSELDQLVSSFVTYCREHGWRIAFHQATANCWPVYERAGFRWIKLGDDAIVQLDRVTLAGKAGKPMRTKLNQFDKLGITARLYTPPLPEEVLTQAQSVSEEWLQIPGRRERQFTLGRFDRDYLREMEVLAAHDAEGRMLGFVNFIPSYRAGEATLDLMRRRTDGPNGIIDFLLIHAFLIARERGLERFNLGMSPMSGFQPGEHSTIEERTIHAFFQRLNFIFSFRGLRAYKAKFASAWEPRYLVYRNLLDLPLLPLALSRVSELPRVADKREAA